MADPLAPSVNPFDEIGEGAAQNDNIPPIATSAPAPAAPKNEFDAIGPELGDGSSALGSFTRAAARAVIPSIAAFPAIGAGATAGATAGLVGGPVGSAIGAVVGGVAAGFGASYAASVAQDYAIEKLPDTWQEAIGQDQRQRKLDEEKHGTAAFLGGLVPTVLTMKPGLPSKVPLRENATALERIMSYPATAAVFGGGVMGGMELGTQIAGDRPVNWSHVAVATGVGVVFNRTTAFGERLIETGSRRARGELGVPEPSPAAVPEGVPEAAPAATPEAPAVAPSVAPGFVRFYHGAAGGDPLSGGGRWLTQDPVYARDFRSEGNPKDVFYVDIPEDSPLLHKSFDDTGTDQKAPYVAFEAPEEIAKGLRPYQAETPKPPGVTEKEWNETILGQKPPPTVLEAADAKVMGPGVTESVFMGTQEQAPSAALTSQQAVRNEKLALGESPITPDVTGTARQMEPELFAHYDNLVSQQAELRRALGEAEAEGGAGFPSATHLKAVDAEIAEIAPQVAAAHRRAADAKGAEAVEPSTILPGVSRETAEGSRPLQEQRDFIVRDVEQKLIEAGRSPEEARAAAQLVAARYETRAARFDGKLGTAQDLYLREGPEIAGSDGKIIKTDTPARAREDLVRVINSKASPEVIASHPVVREANAYNNSRPSTTALPGYGTPEFRANREFDFKGEKVKGYDQAIDRLTKQAEAYSDGPVAKDREAILVWGPPAAGKSMFAEKLAKGRKAAIADPDDAKKVIPEFERGRAGSAVHEESSEISAEVLKKLVSQGANLVLPRVGHDLAKAREYVTALQEQGYRVSVVNMTVEPGEAYRRMIRRFLKSGRVIGSDYFTGVGTKPRENYYTLKNEGLFDEGLDINANGPPGTAHAIDNPDSPIAAVLGLRRLDAGQGLEGAAKPAEAAAAPKPEAETVAAEPVRAAYEAVEKIDALTPAQQKRELPKFTPERDSTLPNNGPGQPAGVFMFDPLALGVDAERFQFKSGGDEYGVTGALRSVTKWDPAKAQAIIAWEQNDGKLFVADGHQRAGLARRLTTEGTAKGIELPGILYREVDGISADYVRALAAATNIANGSGSALDGAKILRARPDLMDGSIPLSAGKGQQAVALARLGDEPFRMVVNEVIPENYGAIVGELIPKDAERQLAAIKAIARFEPKNAEEAAVLTQRVAAAELAKKEEGSQTSMFGDLETAESTAGEEMRIVGRAIQELKKDKGLFSRVVSNAERIEATGSKIEVEKAKSVATDAEVFAKTLASDAYAAGPLRTELVAAAKDLKDGKTSIGEAATRILTALRTRVEDGVSDGVGNRGRAEPAREFAQGKDLPTFETNRTVREDGAVVPASRKQALDWLAEQGAVKREASVTRDVTLPSGDVLPNRTLRGEVYDLPDGRTVEIRFESGSSNPASPRPDKTSIVETRPEFRRPEFEPGAEGKPQQLIPGVEPIKPKTQRDLIEARARAPLRGGNKGAKEGGLFDFEGQAQKELFQRDQTTTPQFKKWFGESKVVDAEGAPQVVYHGTNQAFEAFSPEKLAAKTNAGSANLGFFFTDNSLIAANFSRGEGGNVIPAYLSLKNPLEIGTRTASERRRESKDAYDALHDAIVKTSGKPSWNEVTVQDIRDWRQKVIDAGFDGLVFRKTAMDAAPRSVADPYSDHFVAFHPEQIKSATGNTGAFDPNSPKILEQTARGKVRIAEGRKPIITMMKDANASTFMHESGHVWLEEIMRDAVHPNAPALVKDDAGIVQRWLGVETADDIKTKHHEKFARGFEQYLREGVAPSPQLAGVFARFKDWLVSIYETLKGLGAPINDDIRGVFDRMLATEPQRTVVAPEREATGPTIHDIHETEAQHVQPVEAGPAADRIAAETDRFAAELTPEVKRELETEILKIEPQPEAGAGGAEPAGKTGDGAGEGPEVGPGSGKPGALTASRDGGAESGAVSEGGGGAAAESVVSRPDVDTGNPLAPRPTELFGAEQSPHLDKAGNIRLDTLTNVEEVRQAIRDAAAANQDFIGDRRGVVTDGQVMDVARAAGMEGAERLVRDRIVGQAFSAEEVMTLRLALVQSATGVSVAMKKAAIGTDADVMAYAMAKDRHQLLQATVAQATAEAGRALRAFRNIAGMGAEAKTADLFMREATGKTLFQLRQEARLGATLDTPEAVSKFMVDSQKRTFGHMMVEYWINGLLSGPATHTTNIIGNLVLTLQHMAPETAAAAAIGAARRAMGRQGETVRIGEVGARVKGMIEGIPSGIKGAAESFKAGVNMLLPGEEARALPFQHHTDLAVRPVLDENATYGSLLAETFGAVQGMRDGIIAAGALLKAGGVEGAPMIGTRHHMVGAIPDIEVKGMNVLPLGTAARLPGRFLSAADGFFRAVNYSMEKNARAYRMASEEGLSGTRFDARVADIRQNPTPEMMQDMVEQASRLTLMDKGGKFLAALSHLSNAEIGGFPALKFVTPFVHVAGNILKQSVVERTPLGLLSPELRADLTGKNGNVAQDMAQARMLVGTGLAITIGTLTAQGLASGSGPTDPAEAAMWRLAGNQAHSVRIGDTWYSVQKLGPLGMLMGIAADMWDVSKSAAEGEMTEAASHVIHAFSQNVLDQSVMKGPAELLRAINDSDRYGEQYVRNFLSAFVPYSVGMQQLSRQSDPYSRQARTVVDAMRAKIPGHLDSYFENPLFPKRSIWGEPMLAPETVGGFGVTSIAQKQISTDPVNVAMLELGISPAPVSRKIRNVELTEQQFDDFARVSGIMTKQRLDVIVNSPDWRTWPNYVKTQVINETVRQSRETARGLMMAKWPQIVRDATEQKLDKFRD